LLCATGMGVGEACALDVDDYCSIYEGALEMTVGAIKGRSAFVLGEEAVKALREYLTARRRVETANDALFINVRRGRLSAQGVNNVLGELGGAAGLKARATPRTIHNTIEKLLIDQRADRRAVREFLGKASFPAIARWAVAEGRRCRRAAQVPRLQTNP
jgi:integrase/recombinase XerC